MQHLALLYYGLSLTTGCVSIGIALLINTQYRKEVIRFYVLFLGRLAGLETNRCLPGLAGVLDKGGSSSSSSVLPSSSTASWAGMRAPESASSLPR